MSFAEVLLSLFFFPINIYILKYVQGYGIFGQADFCLVYFVYTFKYLGAFQKSHWCNWTGRVMVWQQDMSTCPSIVLCFTIFFKMTWCMITHDLPNCSAGSLGEEKIVENFIPCPTTLTDDRHLFCPLLPFPAPPFPSALITKKEKYQI